MQILANTSNIASILMSGALMIMAVLHAIFYRYSSRRASHIVAAVADFSMIYLILFSGQYAVFAPKVAQWMEPTLSRPLSFIVLTILFNAIQYVHASMAKLTLQNKPFILTASIGYLILIVLYFLLPPQDYRFLKASFMITNFVVQVYVYRQLILSLRKGDRNCIFLLCSFSIFVIFSIVGFICDFQSHEYSWADYLLLFLLLLLVDINLVVRSGLIVKNRNGVSEHWNKALHTQIEALQNSNNSKDKFLSIIAHDLKNPISSIKTLSEVYMQEALETKSQHQLDMAESLSISIDNIYKLLENLLTWSRTQNDTIKCCPSALSISELLADLHCAVDSICQSKGIALRTFVNCSDTIVADPNMLQTILRNLITNSVKFSYPDSFIDLIFDSQDSNYIIKVVDNGVGMSKDAISKLFKIDQITSQHGTHKEQGTGLGLILCNEFIRKHGGTINVSSEVGLGTTFTVTLPKKRENLQ